MYKIQYYFRKLFALPFEYFLKSKLFLARLFMANLKQDYISLVRVGMYITNTSAKEYFQIMKDMAKEQGRNLDITLKDIEESEKKE